MSPQADPAVAHALHKLKSSCLATFENRSSPRRIRDCALALAVLGAGAPRCDISRAC